MYIYDPPESIYFDPKSNELFFLSAGYIRSDNYEVVWSYFKAPWGQEPESVLRRHGCHYIGEV